MRMIVEQLQTSKAAENVVLCVNLSKDPPVLKAMVRAPVPYLDEPRGAVRGEAMARGVDFQSGATSCLAIAQSSSALATRDISSLGAIT